MKTLAIWMLLGSSAVSAQGLFAPGGVVYPSPAARAYVDRPVAECVIARPCPTGECVVLTPCPPGTLVPPPVAATLPAPPLPAPEPKAVEPREPLVIEVHAPAPCPTPVVMEPPKAPTPPVAKVAPKPAPKKSCPC